MSNFYQKKAKKYKLKYLNLLNQLGGGCMTREEADAQINSELTKNGVQHIEMDNYNKRLSELMCPDPEPEPQPQRQPLSLEQNQKQSQNPAQNLAQNQGHQPQNLAQYQPQNHGHQPQNLANQQVKQYLAESKSKDQAFIAQDLRETLNIFRNNINLFLNGQQNEPLLKEINTFINAMNKKLLFFSSDCNCNCVSLKQNN
jgi:hypothetical protein